MRRYRKVIGSVLTQYDIRDARVIFLRDLDNTTFRVDSLSKTGQERFLLRIHTPHPHGWAPVRHSKAGISSELQWLVALRRDTDITVPEPVPTRSGELIAELLVDGVPQPRLCTLLRWKPGQFIDKRRTRVHCVKLGILMAKLHRHAERWDLPEGFMRPRWDAEGLRTRIFQLHPAKNYGLLSADDLQTIKEYTEQAVEVMRKLGTSREAFGLIHFDLHRRNYLFYRGEIFPIDFDTCGFGYYFFDMVASLYHLSPEERRGFFEGYQSIRALPSDYAHYVEMFFVMRLMHIFASSIQRAIERRKQPNSWRPPPLLMRKYLQGKPFLFQQEIDDE